jgi:hypothetical protein
MVILAIWRNNYWLRLITTVVLLTIVIFREASIYTHARTLIWENRSTAEGDKLEGFANGARSVADYCGDTSVLVYVIFAALVVLCARGFWQSKRND